MTLLLHDLLAYTEASREPDAPAHSVDMNEVLRRSLSNLAQAIEESGAVIESGALPPVRGRETPLIQLFQNLVGNAIKYRTPERPPRIRIEAERTGSMWEFAVRDNGVGIAPVYHRQVFGVFKRLHGREIPGTGIGLAICQRVVERAGGRIWVESEPNAGATFRFTLPAWGGDPPA